MSPAVLGQAAVPGVTEHIPEKAATLEEDEEAAVNYAGSAFNQDLPFLQFNDSISSPPRELDLDNVLLSDSLQVHPPAHFYAGSAPALTWYSAPFDDSHGCDDAALDSFIPQDVPDSDILDAPSTSMGLPWVIIEAQDAIYTTDYLQLMEDSLLPQSTFAISDMPPTDLHHHASPAYGSTSHPQAPSPEQADIVGEVQQDAMSVSMIDLQGPQYGPALPSRVLESERHPNPRSIPDLVDETRSGAHRDPLPSLSGVANSGNLAAPPVQSALSSTSRKSRKPRRTLDALKNPDLKHNVKCSGCDNYYSKKELSYV
ncbi:uncharacterized protein K489DRAFT_413420 [Dissoconium aciculare CBS 342.82]|uniref:Uncharacterized protein n=1 Tax=Dissoconium aciculare CBS 342.82 TaxID=1314786 RepID=A0A6J3LT75_9PEZI|nr:uncharacterized protein K489DRAFT_413420 [Dissoconium aciculare CBS 342.82]KAF1818981.1 hypothetical protein K489DRAFT_413420 [Dissoconium aciculare CBS 342.82]